MTKERASLNPRLAAISTAEKCWQADGEVSVVFLQSSSEFSECAGLSSASALEAMN
jgi:hypothetical protein